MAPERPPRTEVPFGDAVYELLENDGRSQQWLCGTIDVSKSHLSRLLSGAKRPSEDVVVRTAEAFGLPPEYFAEARRFQIERWLDADPALVDRIHKQLSRRVAGR